jgi:hypothetical protein
MTELERKLIALGAELDLPEPPDLGARVRARLAEPQVPRRRGRRILAVALAVLAVAIGAAFAVPQARTAILEWLGLRGATIELVPELPTTPPASADLGLGPRVTLAEARRRAAYDVVLPVLLGRPHDVHFTAALPGGQVAAVYPRQDPERPPLLFTEFRADGLELIQKLAGPETRVEPVTVSGEPGYWLAGAPHSFLYRDPDGDVREETFRLAGNVLLWQRGELTLRLEGVATRAEALRIAESVR